MEQPRVCLVTPAVASANNGNWHTAARWQRFLAPLAQVTVVTAWQDEPADAMIALHARRSADSILRYRQAGRDAPLAVVLTGTDLYRDLDVDMLARQALGCASHVIVLQDEALNRLDPAVRSRARVIVQSATALRRREPAPGRCELVAVGHLRNEKDPLVLMKAARLLPAQSLIRITQVGAGLDPALAEAAHETAASCRRYRWLGPRSHVSTRRRIAGSHALVHMSRMEGGANVVIEAVRSGVPVLASRIDGNVGLLGRSYEGYFTAGDADELAALMRRFECDAAFAATLAAQCALRAPGFAPQCERHKVRTLLADLLANRVSA